MSLAAQLPETHATAPGASASVSLTYTRRTLLGLGALSVLPGCARLTLEQAPPVALPGTRCIDVASGGHTHRIMLAVPPAACVDCGLCETRCPYHLPIRQMLKDCAAHFEEEAK